ncbi:7384_t:CDS:2, partial [Funneliformis caledonium]
MNKWMFGGVDEGISIDPYTRMVKVYSRDANTNRIICQETHI